MREEWIVFYAPDGKELGAYTMHGTFEGELQATKELLASENGLEPGEIKSKIEKRTKRGEKP